MGIPRVSRHNEKINAKLLRYHGSSEGFTRPMYPIVIMPGGFRSIQDTEHGIPDILKPIEQLLVMLFRVSHPAYEAKHLRPHHIPIPIQVPEQRQLLPDIHIPSLLKLPVNHLLLIHPRPVIAQTFLIHESDISLIFSFRVSTINPCFEARMYLEALSSSVHVFGA